MSVFWTLLIVAIPPAAPIEANGSAAEELFACSFDPAWDENFDGWPDGWSRQRGPRFPRYVRVEIREEPAPSHDRCLRIDLDGGGAAAYSPAIPVSPTYSHVMECRLRTEGLDHDRAFLSLTLLDQQRVRLETVYSERVRQTDGWAELRLGPVAAASPEARLAVLGLHLEPGARADLVGSACFDDVRLRRVPRVALSIDGPQLVPAGEGKIAVRCQASGFHEEETSARFRLIDVEGRTVAAADAPLTRLASPHQPPALSDAAGDEPPGLIGSAEWSLPVPGPGFYRVHLEIAGGSDDDPVGSAETTLAVIEPQPRAAYSEFGWTLPRGELSLGLDELVQLADASGVGRVKYPLWFDASTETARLDEVIRFGQRLAGRGIELVGLLADPPLEIPNQFDPAAAPLAAEVFSEPADVWSPSLETVMTRLATQVRRWQLGTDTDTSFVGYPDLAEKIADVKAELDRLGYSVETGFGWDLREGMPPAGAGPPPWRFVTLWADPPLAPDRLAEKLSETRLSQPQRWVALEPLDRSRPTEQRAADLVRRIVAAKLHGAEGIFVPDAFGTERGLLNDDGTPGELLLPWRTAAVWLGGAEPLGSIRMPAGSSNCLFARGDGVVMVVFNDAASEERIHLGPNIHQVDLWGRRLAVADEEHRQRIAVGPLPTFVTGIDARTVRWRQGLELAADKLPGVFGQRHANELRLANRLDEDAEGVLRLVAPQGWQIDPPEVRFKLAAGEELRRPLEVTLPYDTTTGRHPIRVDFEIAGPPPLVFSAYRHVDVGLGDVSIELSTRLNDEGELEVRQQLVNEGLEPVSFRCLLYAPGRRRLRTEVLDQGRGDDVQTYRLPDGAALAGQTLWLRAEDLNDRHILNYRFVVQP